MTVVTLAVVTGVMGILYAVAQRQYKRMLAYSSVENIGIITLGIGLGMLGRSMDEPLLVALGFGGALLHVLNHSLFKGLLFLSAGAVLHATQTDDLERLGGLAKRDPANAMLFLIGALAISALPPLNGFVGEFLIYSGFMRSTSLGSPLVTSLAGVGIASLALIGGLALSAFAKLYAAIFLGQPRDAEVVVHRTPGFMVAGMSVLAIACILVGIGAPFVGRLLAGPIGILGHHRLPPDALLGPVLSPLASVSSRFVLLAVAIGTLVLLRRKLMAPALLAAPQATWGCGFALPTARMQYSGSSFGGTLVDSFRHVLRPRRAYTAPVSCFAAGQHLSTESADAAIRYGYRPLFATIARGCARLWPLQDGRIQLYLMYIVATLMIVFAVEAWSSPGSSKPREQSSATTVAPRTAENVHHSAATGGNPTP